MKNDPKLKANVEHVLKAPDRMLLSNFINAVGYIKNNPEIANRSRKAAERRNGKASSTNSPLSFDELLLPQTYDRPAAGPMPIPIPMPGGNPYVLDKTGSGLSLEKTPPPPPP